MFPFVNLYIFCRVLIPGPFLHYLCFLGSTVSDWQSIVIFTDLVGAFQKVFNQKIISCDTLIYFNLGLTLYINIYYVRNCYRFSVRYIKFLCSILYVISGLSFLSVVGAYKIYTEFFLGFFPKLPFILS